MSSWKIFKSSGSYKRKVQENIERIHRLRNTVPWKTPDETVENNSPDSLKFDQLNNEANSRDISQKLMEMQQMRP